MGSNILSHFLYSLRVMVYQGLDYFNQFMPKFSPSSDIVSERFKSFLYFGVIGSIIIGGLHPLGLLYSTFLRPLLLNVALLHRIELEAGYILTPESGMHYMTIIIYFFATYKLITHFENLNIVMPLHKLIYSFSLMFLTLFVPFEYVYLILCDIFHSIPVYNYPVFLSYGWWYKFPDNIFKTLMFVDSFYVFGSLYCMWFVKREILFRYPDLKFKTWNKISKLFLFGYILSTFLWIIMPLYSNVDFVWGTNYFPQTIYPEYGYYDDYNITIQTDGEYGIVNEIWVKNDLVKIWNHVSKGFSVAFMFYTFAPRRKKINI